MTDVASREGLGRKLDYLQGFLAESAGDLYESIVSAIREIFDPEIPVNIYDLGLIYGVKIANDSSVVVTMTLTTPNCPVAESMPNDVARRVASVSGVQGAEVILVWDPPWDSTKISDEAKLEMGML